MSPAANHAAIQQHDMQKCRLGCRYYVGIFRWTKQISAFAVGHDVLVISLNQIDHWRADFVCYRKTAQTSMCGPSTIRVEALT